MLSQMRNVIHQLFYVRRYYVLLCEVLSWRLARGAILKLKLHSAE